MARDPNAKSDGLTRKYITMDTIDVRSDPETEHHLCLTGSTTSSVSIVVHINRNQEEIDRHWAYMIMMGKARLPKGIE